MLLKGVTQTPLHKPGAGGGRLHGRAAIPPPTPQTSGRGPGLERGDVMETPQLGTGGTATTRPVSQGGGTSGHRLEARIDRETEKGFTIGVYDENGSMVAALAVYRPLRVAVAVAEEPLWQRLQPVAEKYENDKAMSDEDLVKAVEEAVNA